MDNNFPYGDNPWPKTDAKEIVFSLIKTKSKVLDLGCWTGRFGEKLKKEKDCFVVGIDFNNKALQIAEKRLDKTYFFDLDQPERLPEIFKENTYDYICATDVLEHLKNPCLLIKKAKKLLKKNGKLIISVPNIANISIRMKLLLGKFIYEKTGILDETHLHFYTLKTAQELLETSGYDIERFYYSGRQFFPSLFAFQFVFVCKSKVESKK